MGAEHERKSDPLPPLPPGAAASGVRQRVVKGKDPTTVPSMSAVRPLMTHTQAPPPSDESVGDEIQAFDSDRTTLTSELGEPERPSVSCQRDRAALLRLDGAIDGQVIFLPKSTVLLGRSRSADIRIDEDEV